MRRPWLLPAGFIALAVLQCLLYRSYIEREIAWNYVFRGDTNWYNFYAYRFFEALLKRDWDTLVFSAKTFPWGILLFVESAFMQLLLGASRFSMTSVNLVHFLVVQWATFVFFRRIGGSAWGGAAALLLLFTMRTPFRGDGPGLNIVDFHFDLVFFYLFLLIIYLVALSDTFSDRRISLLVSVLAALTVATRIVSFFLLTGIFGVLFLYLLLQWYRSSDISRNRAGRRVINLALAGITFLVLCAIPIGIASDAVYAHYFRFVFEPQFREDRSGLYIMGATLQAEAYELIRRMLSFDFGWPFALVLVAFGSLVVLGRRGSTVPTGAATAPLSVMDDDGRRSFIGFLVLAIVVSYGMHLVFPIKSDHLTRMTAAPILVLIAFLGAGPVGRALQNVKGLARGVAVFLLFSMGAIAAYVQVGFYGSTGRLPISRETSEKVRGLYADISRIASQRNLTTVAISVDKITSYELGPLYGYFTYEYENNRRLLKPAPQFGAVIDQPISFDRARWLLDRSDFVLLLEDTYPTGARWPLMKSVQSFHPQLQHYVRDRFCLVNRYRIEGLNNGLYMRPAPWRVSASASTQPQYGPHGLLGAGGVIWHAPWSAGTATQWIDFDTESPVALTRLHLTAQDGAPARAPRDFVLEAVGENGRHRVILEVGGASFETKQTESWEIPEATPVKQYRLVFTKNNGDPNLLTVQDLRVDVAALPCRTMAARSQ